MYPVYNEVMEMNFCRRCSSELSQINGHVYKCANGHTLFANPSPAVAIWLVNDKDEVLVAERGINPGIGMLDAPGGFIDGDAETFEQAVAREVEEEVGIAPNQYEQPIFLVSSIDHYEYGNELIPVLSGVYWARLKDTVNVKPQDDVSAARFTPINEINLKEVFFQSARDGLMKLKSLL